MTDHAQTSSRHFPPLGWILALVALGCSSSAVMDAGADASAPGDVAPDLDVGVDTVDASTGMDVVNDAGADVLTTVDAPVIDTPTTASGVDVVAPVDVMDSGMDAWAMDTAPDGSTVSDSSIDVPLRDAASDVGPALDSRDVAVSDVPPAVPAPRLIAPLSAGRVTNRRPTLHWVLPAGVTRVHVQVCGDRPCAHELASWDVTGASVRPTIALPPGVAFWRVQQRNATGTVVASSATWEFEVPHRDAPTDTSWGVIKDFNGDGFDDVATGVADGYSGYGYVYLGSALGLPPSASIALCAPLEADSANFGSTFSGAGDVNGDGLGDLLAGADSGDGVRGFFAVYLGNVRGISSSPTPLILGPAGVFSGFGGRLRSAGDVNGDGYSDVVVGAAMAPDVPGMPDYHAGYAYVYLGGPLGLDPTPAIRVSATVTEWVGYSVAGAGDVDGDGYADVLVGAPLHNSGSGGAYLYFGGPSGLSVTDVVVLENPGPVGGYGLMVESAGDVNGDGLCDFTVSAPTWVMVYLGNRVRSFATPFQMINRREGGLDALEDIFGLQSSAPGDLNGDGFSDLAIGVPCMVPLGHGVCGGDGWVYVYPGSPDGVATTPSVSLTSSDVGRFGHSARIAGDVNGDGFDDLLVGAPGNFELGASFDYGTIYEFGGGPAGVPTVPTWSFRFGDWIGSGYGWEVACLSMDRFLTTSILSIVRDPQVLSLTCVGADIVFPDVPLITCSRPTGQT